MAAPVGSLVVRVGSDTRGLTSGLSRSSAKVRKFGSDASRAGKKADRAFKGLTSTLGIITGAVGAVAGALAIRGFASVILSSVKLGDSLSKLNDRLGLSVEFLSEMRFAADRSGIEFTVLTKALQKGIEGFEEFRSRGTGEAALGLAVFSAGIREAVKDGQSFETLLPRMADEFKKLDNAQAVFAASKLFGARGIAMLQLFKDGSAGIRELREQSRELGATWTTLEAQEAAALQDRITDLSTAWEGLKRGMLDTFGPAITAGINSVTDALTGQAAAILDMDRVIFEERVRLLQEANPGRSPGSIRDAVRSAFAPKPIGPPVPPPPVTGPPIPSALMETGSGSSSSEIEDAQKEALGRRIEQLRQSLLTEREIEIEAHEQRMVDIASAMDLEDADKEALRQQREALEKAHQGRLGDIEGKGIRERAAFEKARAAERLRNFLGQADAIAGLAGTLSQTLFENSKGAAIVESTVLGIAGAIRTWNTYPYPFNILPTALHIAGTAARLSQLKSTSFGGGGGGAVTPAQSAGAGGIAVPGQGAGAGSTVNISLQGDRFNREQVRDLIHEINEAVDDGARLNVR